MADVRHLLFLADGRLVVKTEDDEMRQATEEERQGSRMIWPLHRRMGNSRDGRRTSSAVLRDQADGRLAADVVVHHGVE
jgi:hypothetical protein